MTDVRPQQAENRHRRLLCYYGDDFTGSTDVLEALFHAGLRTILFLETPTLEMLHVRFRDADCFGIAGVGRSLSPEAMDRELRPIFAMCKTAGAAIFHYKICSTFDSSPGIGSIGKAAEIGLETFGGQYRFIPMLAGVPYLRRYTVFGHHFAGSGSAVYRLDRHPTMSRHPVTPMAESDLREHIRLQTMLRVSLLDIVDLEGNYAGVRRRLNDVVREERPDIVLFDVLDDARFETAGRLMWEEAAHGDGLFVIGSSGVEYALGAAWRAEGLTLGANRRNEAADAVDRLLIVSGSCSPITQRQIGKAIEAGYAGIRVPVEEWVLPDRAEAVAVRLRQEALKQLEAGRSVILYTASGPQDESIVRLRETLTALGLRAEDSGRMLGTALGSLAKELAELAGLTRIVIAGGDTSGYVTRELGIYAMECMARLEPGGPICRAYADDPRLDGLELVLKGGQVGSENFFEHVRLGRVPESY